MKEIKFNEDGTVNIDGEVFVKLQSDAVPEPKTKLQEARERYKAGDMVRSLPYKNAMYTGEKLYEGIILDNFYTNHNEVWALTDDNYRNVLLYDGLSWAEILPYFPTIEEIYGSVKSCYWACQNGNIGDIKYVSECTIDFTLVPTKEDAEHILASMQLINIAKYYNDKYPDEKKDRYLAYNVEAGGIDILDEKYFYKVGQLNLTESAANDILSNHNLTSVLIKYFRIE